MLRALGFNRRKVRRAFLLEMLTLVSLGTLVGTGIAVLVSVGIWFTRLRDLRLPYQLPSVELAVLAALGFAATILATLWPILTAAKTSPAEAVRYIE